MNYHKLTITIGTIAAGAVLLSAIAIPAFADTGTGLGISATLGATAGTNGLQAILNTKLNGSAKANLETQSITKADTEIQNRIDALTALSARVNAMERLSADEKNSLSTSLQAQITAMTNLQSQIGTDENSTTSLKLDIQSITKAYRVYALILPQGEIAAASDRIMTIASAMTTLSGDLEIRINNLQDAAAGGQPFPFNSNLLDMNAKVADADTQAQAAVNITASLQPDNGDATVMASNTAALKTARTDIQTAQQDLIAARADALTIISAIKAMEKMTVTASTTAR